MTRQQHSCCLLLLLLHALGHLFVVTSAFHVRHCKKLPSLFLPPLGDENAASSSQSSTHALRQAEHVSRPRDAFQLGEFLHQSHFSVVALIASAVIMFPPPSVATAQQTFPLSHSSVVWPSSIVMAAADYSSSITPNSINDLGLKPPTEQKPQIMLNGGSPDGQTSQQTMPRKTTGREPILQGLVYFPERAPANPAEKSPSGPQVKQQMDYYSDILVLTAVSAAHPEGPVLAGAKFPVSSVRFPFSFQMQKENLLTSRPGVQDAWDSVVNTGDIILRASVCPSDSSSFPCDESETKKSAEGLAKLIANLPGLEEGQMIRAPASLALQ